MNQLPDDDKSKQNNSKDAGDKVTYWKIILSVVQAAFGVQSKHNRERDFKSGKIMPYVIASVIFTLLFVVAIIFVVNQVLSNAR